MINIATYTAFIAVAVTVLAIVEHFTQSRN
jgi:hypothetical protein